MSSAYLDAYQLLAKRINPEDLGREIIVDLPKGYTWPFYRPVVSQAVKCYENQFLKMFDYLRHSASPDDQVAARGIINSIVWRIESEAKKYLLPAR